MREPCFVVLFDVESATKWMVDGRVVLREETVVDSVNGWAWAEPWWNERKINGMISLFRRCWGVVTADDVGAMVGGAENDEGASLLVRELGDAAGGGLTLNSDADHDEVIDLKETLANRSVGA